MTLREQVMAAVVSAPDDRLTKALDVLSGKATNSSQPQVVMPELVDRNELAKRLNNINRSTIYRNKFPVYSYLGGKALYDLAACLKHAQTIRFKRPSNLKRSKT